ncbi:MAG TPA: DUF1003 domain-containing protein [bacterium]|nr:DUF1003 domain-containing protein [bacterium]
MSAKSQHVTCQVCNQRKSRDDVLPADLVRPTIVDAITADGKVWDPAGYICFSDLHRYRSEHIADLLEMEKGELSELDRDVVRTIERRELLSIDLAKEMAEPPTTGQRLADRVASFGGSWNFILLFGLVIFVWVGINSLALVHRPFDPYPFILLNLMLSLIAAVQAPVIMMSQNRMEAKDRQRAENDYRVNLKSELEIRVLNEKIDHLLSRQWQRLLEIQDIQMDFMQELARRNEPHS